MIKKNKFGQKLLRALGSQKSVFFQEFCHPGKSLQQKEQVKTVISLLVPIPNLLCTGIHLHRSPKDSTPLYTLYTTIIYFPAEISLFVIRSHDERITKKLWQKTTFQSREDASRAHFYAHRGSIAISK